MLKKWNKHRRAAHVSPRRVGATTTWATWNGHCSLSSDPCASQPAPLLSAANWPAQSPTTKFPRREYLPTVPLFSLRTHQQLRVLVSDLSPVDTYHAIIAQLVFSVSSIDCFLELRTAHGTQAHPWPRRRGHLAAPPPPLVL